MPNKPKKTKAAKSIPNKSKKANGTRSISSNKTKSRLAKESGERRKLARNEIDEESSDSSSDASSDASSVSYELSDLTDDLPDIADRIDVRSLPAHLLSKGDTARKRRRGKKKQNISSDTKMRLKFFRLAQRKRREKYGEDRPWGILCLYDHLTTVRIDMEWANDAALRYQHDGPYLSWTAFDEQKKVGLKAPVMTYGLLILCTVTLFVSVGANGWEMEPFYVNPALGPSGETLILMGAKETNLIVNENEGWRLITSMILHAGVIHYALNMLSLWFIGSVVEQNHGSFAAALILMISSIGGTILSALFLPRFVTVGASGGIFGLIGACLADIILNWSLLFNDFVTDKKIKRQHGIILFWLGIEIFLNVMLGITPFVDNFIHMGGLIYGFLCGLSTLERQSMSLFGIKTTSCQREMKVMTRFFGLTVCVISLMISGSVLQFSGGESPCSSCRKLSCLEFPSWASEFNKWWYCDDCATVQADRWQESSTRPGMFDMVALTCPNDLTLSIQLAFPVAGELKGSINIAELCREMCPVRYRDL
mmetsp:Transcript_27425/g.62976  ORF Transcript_27425/g.62976 Transcript_27425/m.62976 type:complete len:538 (-) Transcript_27425:275-1888(-)